MVDILHRVGIKSSVDRVYQALSTREGGAAWWTTNTTGESKVGGVLKFTFSAGGVEIGGFDMKVLELQPAKRVLWEGSVGRQSGSTPGSVLISNNPATMPSFFSSIRVGRNRWNSCTIAALSGRCI
jgi:hypothetical protein